MGRRKRNVSNHSPAPQAAPKIGEPVNVSLRLSSQLAEKIEAYCAVTGVSRNGMISVAISDFLSERI